MTETQHPELQQPETHPEVKRRQAGGVEEVYVLWTSEGMSCDGDTVSTTNGTNPSIEDIVMGGIRGLPKVHLHNQVLHPSLGG